MLSDTAGRPWRSGQTDFALGAAGVEVLDDLRGATDADGRALTVTSRAIADELAAAADLVKGKADAVPVALVRGAGAWVGLRRTEPERRRWCGPAARTGSATATPRRCGPASGVEPGTPAADECGIAAVLPEPVADRIGRAVRVALHDLPDVGIDAGSADLRVSADDPFSLGRAVARLEVALWGEGLARARHAVSARPDSRWSLRISEL